MIQQPQHFATLNGKIITAAVCLISLFLFQSVSFIFSKSLTWDETKYLGVGKHLLDSESWTPGPARDHPPLSFYLSSMGMAGLELNEPVEPSNPVERGKHLLHQHGDTLIYRARLPMLVLGCILGISLFLWSYELYGNAGSLVTLSLFSISPNLIAHQSLITPDFALTTFFFTTAWCFYRSIISGRYLWFLALGVSTGFLLLSKFTSLFVLPISLLWLITIYRQRSEPFLYDRFWLKISTSAFVSIIIVCIAYRFQLNLIYDGIAFQYQTSRSPWPAYFLGIVRQKPVLAYFTTTILLKLPIPLLVLTACSQLATPRLQHHAHQLTRTIAFCFLLFFVAYFSFFSHLNIGFRYLLPMVPFLILISGQCLFISKSSRLKAVTIGLLLLGQAASILYAGWSQPGGPHYLSYFNELSGGPSNGYLFLADSNLDWGQDLKGLKRYIDQHPQEQFLILYWGSMPLDFYGLRPSKLPSPEKAPTNVLVAISTTRLLGIYEEDPIVYRWLLQKPTIARIGYSIHIFRL